MYGQIDKMVGGNPYPWHDCRVPGHLGITLMRSAVCGHRQRCTIWIRSFQRAIQDDWVPSYPDHRMDSWNGHIGLWRRRSLQEGKNKGSHYLSFCRVCGRSRTNQDILPLLPSQEVSYCSRVYWQINNLLNLNTTSSRPWHVKCNILISCLCQQMVTISFNALSFLQIVPSTHVRLRRDLVCRLLEAPYTGPFRVLERANKFFVLELPSGERETVSIDRLKSAHLPPTSTPPIPTPLPPESASIPTPRRVNHRRPTSLPDDDPQPV